MFLCAKKLKCRIRYAILNNGIKGNTASNVTKSATVETGAVVQVPLFINEGDKIKIDTRTGEYLSRVNN